MSLIYRFKLCDPFLSKCERKSRKRNNIAWKSSGGGSRGRLLRLLRESILAMREVRVTKY
jgi:hypothetical protein